MRRSGRSRLAEERLRREVSWDLQIYCILAMERERRVLSESFVLVAGAQVRQLLPRLRASPARRHKRL